MRKLLAIASIALLVVTACTPKPRDIIPKVLWASQSDGIVHLGYKQTKNEINFDPVTPDWISALNGSDVVCKRWGYSGSFYLNDEDDEVNQGFEVDFNGVGYVVFYKIAQCSK